VASGACTPAKAAAEGGCDIPAELAEDVANAEYFGRRMRLHDQAAWLTTDALDEAKLLADIPGQGRGWLTRDEGKRVVVRYFTEVDFETSAFAQAELDVATGKAVNPVRFARLQPATPDELVLLRARQLAIDKQPLKCSSSFNTIVLREPRDAGQIRVYVMSAWDGGPYVFGGHSRVMVSADGRTVNSITPHTRSCLLIDESPPPEPGFEPTNHVMVTHMTSPTPDEFHVFLGLQHQLSVYVVTVDDGRLWMVENGSIRRIARGKEQAARNEGDKP
jgi:hypothetical protein